MGHKKSAKARLTKKTMHISFVLDETGSMLAVKYPRRIRRVKVSA